MSQFKMLAVDLGASSGRGIIGRFDGEHLTLEENHRFPNEPVFSAGSLNWDILRIFHEIKASIGKCVLSDDRDIASIGIDTWGVDYGLLDKNGKLLANPYHYRDGRTDDILDHAFDIMSKDEIYKITGIQTMNFNTLFQLLTDMRDDEARFAAADKMLFIPDLLNYFLTGVKQTEYTIASTGALLDAAKRDWSHDIIKRFGIPEGLFTDIVKPCQKVGGLLPRIQEDTGSLSARVVTVGSHDTASAVIAVPAKGDDFVYISSGTWSLMGSEIAEPAITATTARYDFTNEGGVGGKIRFLKNIMGLWLEQESRRQWIREGKSVTYDELSDMAVASKPLAYLINPDDPSFSAPGNMPRRIAEYCRNTGQGAPETMGEIVRCIFDSLALKYRFTVEKIDEIKGSHTPFINIVGGGTKEPPLCQFTADACARPVYAGPVEATAIGNLVAQAMASGEIANISEARHMIRNSFEITMYEPGDTEKWDEGYERFQKLI
ncbi:MAG: rhamnulokinase [Eubacteriales bacterium]|jgi:rhamnulokinase|nr:rhamnulokinase [Eubacteriales bacterium]